MAESKARYPCCSHASTCFRCHRLQSSSPQNPVYGQAVRKATKTAMKQLDRVPFSTVCERMLPYGMFRPVERSCCMPLPLFHAERIALFGDFMLPLATENPAWVRDRPRADFPVRRA